jgi:hypothetical protein
VTTDRGKLLARVAQRFPRRGGRGARRIWRLGEAERVSARADSVPRGEMLEMRQASWRRKLARRTATAAAQRMRDGARDRPAGPLRRLDG